LDTLDEAGFTTPFPIQERTIPVLLEGSDVIGQAHTGTGKTAAYALPILQKTTAKQGIQGIIMAPTRELALQITSEINRFAKNTGIRTVTIYGGQGMGIQLDALRKKPEIIVATPGRLIDHLKRGTIKLNNVKHVVLDDADIMLDMGFVEDIQFILDLTPEERAALPELYRYANLSVAAWRYRKFILDEEDSEHAGRYLLMMKRLEESVEFLTEIRK